VSIDGNGRRVACDPYRGAIEAVLECAANLACVGAEPLGLTNCLNFGNPEKPHVAWQLDRAVSGLADACSALGVPSSGATSRSTTRRRTARSTPADRGGWWASSRPPTRGALGLRPRRRRHRLRWAVPADLRGSELSKLRGEPLADSLPDVSLEKFAHAARRSARRSTPGASAAPTTVAEGGFAVALAESCLLGGVGARIGGGGGTSSTCFGEGSGGWIPRRRPCLPSSCLSQRIAVTIFGEAGGDRPDDRERGIDVALDDLRDAGQNGLKPYFP
jgi:phosphoribosylformylglycinamidine synthase